jgi:hypothetical protein
MDITVEHDDLGTHFDWQLDGVTPRMIDWLWLNMEKGFVLWHPEQHEYLEWPVPPKHGDPLGAIHNAPQTWDDGVRQDLYIRFERLEDVPERIREVIVHDHVMVVAGLGLSREELERNDPLGYRVHQWSASDTGVVGRSSGVGARKPEDEAAGRIWAAHAAEEIANWEVFLPTLYQLWRVVPEGPRNPYATSTWPASGETRGTYTCVEWRRARVPAMLAASSHLGPDGVPIRRTPEVE